MNCDVQLDTRSAAAYIIKYHPNETAEELALEAACADQRAAAQKVRLYAEQNVRSVTLTDLANQAGVRKTHNQREGSARSNHETARAKRADLKRYQRAGGKTRRNLVANRPVKPVIDEAP